jgi:hypothetical protein
VRCRSDAIERTDEICRESPVIICSSRAHRSNLRVFPIADE